MFFTTRSISPSLIVVVFAYLFNPSVYAIEAPTPTPALKPEPLKTTETHEATKKIEAPIETADKKAIRFESNSNKTLSLVEARYSAADTVRMDVEKEVTTALINKKQKSTGEILIKRSGGKFRLEIKEPEHSLVILDGKTLWIVEYPVDPDFDNTTRITTSSSLEKMQTPVLLTFLIGKGRLLNDFKVKTEKKVSGEKYEFELVPLKAQGDITNLLLTVNSGEKTIDSLVMTDQLQNKTSLRFSNVKFGSKIDDKLFHFKPPKNAEVNRI